ncbi:hypothetical protein [Occallatibacter riparius]|uniref:Ig-like domain-containing protein n=1 Tax=Occallatibacter riparius TaxID=1002689 RepID=A0A9J7BJG2_9BACT|nr:hypothetical protein [Occallatibacter riparius]UWZ81930.1 hypothetical protein MOP44_15235 [Occallatibacter riparius]
MNSAKRIARIALLLGAWGAQCLMASVLVAPSKVTVNPGDTLQFSATGDPLGIYLWNLSGPGCSEDCGSITFGGLYTAPVVAPASQPIIVSATSYFDLSQSGSAAITITSQNVISVQVSPSQASLELGQQQLFTATVSGTTNTAVTWSVSGPGCTGAACGTITSGGLYTAPATMPSIAMIQVTATSKANTSRSGTSTIALLSSIAVSVSPKTVSLYPNKTQQFNATVTGSPVTTVTWSIRGDGCSGSACGMITSAGLYTAPATPPSSPKVTVTATATADPKALGSAVVTLLTPPAITISPKSVSIISGEHIQFYDKVTGTTQTAVTWSVSGTSCPGTACGTISATGLYTSPSNLSAPLEVTVKVTLTALSSVSDVAKVSIVRANNAKLAGHYAFYLNGFDANGIQQCAGTIYADGKGTILSGFEDTNDIINPSTRMAISGTYQIGSDNRGSITVKGPNGTQTLDVVLNAGGTRGRLVSIDPKGVRSSGTIYRQSTSAFDASALDGGYVFSLVGQNKAGGRIGALGLFFPNGSGFVAGCGMDVNEAGGAKVAYGTYSGIYNYDTDGRGTMTLIIPGFMDETFNFVFYIISSNQLLLLSTDPLSDSTPIFSGQAIAQDEYAFSAEQFIGTAVYGVSGKAQGRGDVTIGRLNFQTGDSVIGNYDRNAAGTVTYAGQTTGAYSVQITGRATMVFYDPGDDSTSTWVMYAAGRDTGFILDMSSNAVRIGEITPQDTPPFSNASLVGTFLVGSGEPIVKPAPLYIGYMNFDGSVSKQGNGGVTGMEDVSLASSLLTNQTVSGTYSISVLASDGRGLIELSAPSTSTYQLWLTGMTKALGVQVDSTVVNPAILYIEQ